MTETKYISSFYFLRPDTFLLALEKHTFLLFIWAIS